MPQWVLDIFEYALCMVVRPSVCVCVCDFKLPLFWLDSLSHLSAVWHALHGVFHSGESKATPTLQTHCHCSVRCFAERVCDLNSCVCVCVSQKVHAGIRYKSLYVCMYVHVCHMVSQTHSHTSTNIHSSIKISARPLKYTFLLYCVWFVMLLLSIAVCYCHWFCHTLTWSQSVIIWVTYWWQ